MILSVDTETTGLLNYQRLFDTKAQPYIAQLGAVLYTEEGKIVGQMDYLIKPEGWTIPKEASDIHGIQTEECERYGISIKNALAILNQFLKFKPLVISHNGEGYDFPLIKIECQRIQQTFILEGLRSFDTMKNTISLCKLPKARGAGFKYPKLNELHKTLFGVEFDGAHSAVEDVKACARSYFGLRRQGLTHAVQEIK